MGHVTCNYVVTSRFDIRTNNGIAGCFRRAKVWSELTHLLVFSMPCPSILFGFHATGYFQHETYFMSALAVI